MQLPWEKLSLKLFIENENMKYKIAKNLSKLLSTFTAFRNAYTYHNHITLFGIAKYILLMNLMI